MAQLLQSYSKYRDSSYQPLLVSLLWYRPINGTFAMGKFQRLHDQDENLAQKFAFSSLEHNVMIAAEPS